jgi:tRNA C32,U32 (ribose-2'-O)-methylase TrmJ
MAGTSEQRLASIRAEILAERAASLKLSEQRLRDALAALASSKSGSKLREKAATACLAYIIQRETLGLTADDLQRLRKELGVPDDVWNAMGATTAV